MAQGDQSKALKIVSRRKGWDPDRIWNPKTKSYDDSVENFDQPTQIFTNQAGTGKLPNPEKAEKELKFDAPVTWNTPDVSRENANRRTRDGAASKE